MRTRTRALLACMASAALPLPARADALALPSVIPAATIEDFVEAGMSSQHLRIGGREFVFVVRDYGSGVPLQELYVYAAMGDDLTLSAFARTTCDKLVPRVDGTRLVVRCGRKQVLVLDLN